MQVLDARVNRPSPQPISAPAGAGDLDPGSPAGLVFADLDHRHYAPGAEIAASGEAPQSIWLVDGWVCEARVLADGRRQIFSFAMPGDIVELPLCCSRTVVALTGVKSVDVGQLADRAADAAVVLDASSRAAALAIARRYDHLARLWDRSALGRLASLLIELHDRLDRNGRVAGGEFALPLRHEDLADALGLSTVHVTRCFKTLRERGLATMRFRRVSGFDRAALGELCE